MMLETGKDIMYSVFVGANACISIFFSWNPASGMLGTYDKIISIIAGCVAIVVGIFAIINYIINWSGND